MRQLKFICILLLTLPLLSVECEDPIAEEQPYELPPITQEGANTFGCLINGEVWLPQANDSDDEPLDVNYPIISNFDIRIQKSTSERTDEINLRLKDTSDIWEGKTYNFTKRAETILYFYHDKCLFANANVGGQIIAGELFISRFDSGNRFVSGTFWFTAVSDCDTVFVKDGRFDLLFTKG